MNHADRPDPEKMVLVNGALAATPQQVLATFDKFNIEHETLVHQPLYTV